MVTAPYREATEYRHTVKHDIPAGAVGGVGEEVLAKGLGVFSLGLGLAQIIMPDQVARFIGIKPTPHVSSLMRGIGLRELSVVPGIFMRQRPVGWMRSRVMGDMMDLTLLGSAINAKHVNRQRLLMTIAAVMGVTVLDALCSKWLDPSN
jgi:hypothetical protein